MELNLFDRKAPPPTCFECDHVAEHQHHVVPRSLGGTRMVWLCTKCHSKAHHMSKDPWVNHKKLIKEGIARRRAKGLKIGVGGDIQGARNRKKADEFALNLAPYIERLESRGFRTIMEKMHEMNRVGVPTSTGKGHWHIGTVHRVIKRIERLEGELEQKRQAA